MEVEDVKATSTDPEWLHSYALLGPEDNYIRDAHKRLIEWHPSSTIIDRAHKPHNRIKVAEF